MSTNKEERKSLIYTRKYKYAELRSNIDEESIKYRYFLRAKRIRNVRNSIIISICSIFISLVSLTLVTYAWFTGTVNNSNNIIKAGTLDVRLYSQDLQTEAITDLSGPDSASFIKDDLVPGSEIETKITIKNFGNLDAKYKVYFVVTEPEQEKPLSEYIEVFVKDSEEHVYEKKGALNEYSGDSKPIIVGFFDDSDNTHDKTHSYIVKLKLMENAPQSSTISLNLQLAVVQKPKNED